MIDQALLKFKAKTATGTDDLIPRALFHLSLAGKWALAALFMRCERLQLWPSVAMVNLIMAGIPKASGGCRLIGILPTLLRLWGRIRRPISDAWEASTPHDMFWGGRGKSTTDAAFDSMLRAECMTFRGGGSATVLTDLYKAYETVVPQIMFAEGLGAGLPPLLLVMCLRLYQVPRVLRMFGAHSSTYVARQGTVAGCSHATSMLRALLFLSLLKLAGQFHMVTFKVVVDDVSIQFVSLKQLFWQCCFLAQAVRELFLAFEALALITQFSKCGYVVTSRRLLSMLRTALDEAKVAIDSKGWMRNLGHELPGSGRQKRQQEQERLEQGSARKTRLGKFAKAVGSRVSRVLSTGLHPSWLHGAAASGVGETTLMKQRSLVGAALNILPSESLSAGLLLEPPAVDPITAASAPLVLNYCRFIWESRISFAVLGEAFAAMMRRNEACSGVRWVSSAGPLQATFLTLRRLGWAMEGPRLLVSDLDEKFDLVRVAPKEVVRHLLLTIRRWQKKRAQAKLGYAEEVDYDLLRAIYNNRWKQADMSTEARRGALRQLTVGGLWTRQRLCAHDRALSSCCAHFGQEEDTPGHRWWKCVGTRALRASQLVEATALANTVSELVLGGCLFSLGQPLVYDLPGEMEIEEELFEEIPRAAAKRNSQGCLLSPAPCEAGGGEGGLAELDDEADFEFDFREEEPAVEVAGAVTQDDEGDRRRNMKKGGFRGEVYLDGSGMNPTEPRLRRCGWSAVMISDDTYEVIYALYGPLPRWPQTVPHSEHYALLMAITRAVGDCVFITDCQSVVDYFLLGAGACAAGRPFAQLWRGIRKHKLRLEEEGFAIVVEKVLAHQDPGRFEDGSADQRKCIGNDHADEHAKKGSATHAFQESTIADFKQHREQNLLVVNAVVTAWCFTLDDRSWICKDDALLVVEAPDGAGARPVADPPLVVVQHVLVQRSWGTQCRTCRRWAREPAQMEKLENMKCTPMVAGIAEHDPDGRAHLSHDLHVHETGVVWCEKCGSYADRVLKNLQYTCMESASRSGAAARARLRLGRHPRSGQPLSVAAGPGHRSLAGAP